MKRWTMQELIAGIRLWLSWFAVWLLFLPVWIILQVYLQPEQGALPWVYTLPLVAVAGVLQRKWCNRKWKRLVIALQLGTAALLLTGALSIQALPLLAGGFLYAYMGMTAASRQSNRLRTYIIGIALYFIAAISYARIPVLQPSVSILTWSGSLCLVLALLDSNSSHLRYSSFAGETARLPGGLRRHNRLFVIVFVAVAAALAAGAGRALGLMLWQAVRLIFAWLSQLFSGSEESPQNEAAPPPAMPELPAAEANDPGLLATILNFAFYALATAVIAILLYYGLRWLYRNTGGLLRRMMDAVLSMLRRELPPEAAAYKDEEKSIFTWEKTVQGVKDYWRNKLIPASRRDRWEDMDSSREQTRWLYRHWLNAKRAAGYEVKRYLTPQETEADVAEWAQTAVKKRPRKDQEGASAAPGELLHLYNQARYGEADPPAAEVASLKERLKL
ncbi:hypothetical protein [Paenibacillus sp. HW567]|uniref:hypothetical protein n=1 Tax=Paenibacillus sp. HW567 TaxID=1034769 RepID=UPI0003809332|nr:hypothetical protein [Paenibacillus sp. HW567]